MNCNWAIVSDITLYIVIPTRRSIASATQILISHALGDAISPYLIGAIADWIRPALASSIVTVVRPRDEKLECFAFFLCYFAWLNNLAAIRNKRIQLIVI